MITGAVEMEAALKLVLLFYGDGRWTEQQENNWRGELSRIYRNSRVPSHESTTKVLCDAVRYVLKTHVQASNP